MGLLKGRFIKEGKIILDAKIRRLGEVGGLRVIRTILPGEFEAEKFDECTIEIYDPTLRERIETVHAKYDNHITVGEFTELTMRIIK